LGQRNKEMSALLFEKATIGGTFHAMHVGHRRYIELAFSMAHTVYIHLTTDEYARTLKTYHVKSFAERRSKIEQFLDEQGWLQRAELISLDSEEQIRRFCLMADISLAVVEPAYFEEFKTVNLARVEQGMQEYCILYKPRSKTKSGSDISSTIDSIAND
jgi:phosphopantetheine adenylyltransferase